MGWHSRARAGCSQLQIARTSRTELPRSAGFAVVLFLLCAGLSPAQQNAPAANPARPTVSNPATLPPVGYLQFEQGYLGSLDSPGTPSQYGINQTTKVALASRLMLEMQNQPFARSRVSGDASSSNAAGDTLLGGQIVLYLSPSAPAETNNPASPQPRHTIARPTIALGYLGRVHSGSTPDTDQGSLSNSVLLLISGDVGQFHYDTNYIANEQSESDPIANSIATRTRRRTQFAQTLSVSHPLTSALQISGELYHFSQPFISTDDDGRSIERANLVDGLMALSYTLRPNLVLDGGFSRGFTSTSTRWQSFAGFTYLLPRRLWPGKS